MEKRTDQIEKLIAKAHAGQSEPFAYEADEMLACKGCGRKSPPNRLDCMYCGSKLDIAGRDSETIKLNLRQLEGWEKGFNVIYLSSLTGLRNSDVASIDRLLEREVDWLRPIVDAGKPLPLARVESDEAAVTIEARLRELNIESRTISDEMLNADTLPRRLRRLEIEVDNLRLVDFNSDKLFAIGRDDLALIVVGEIFETRSESSEKRKKGKTNIVDKTETSADEIVVDIYSAGDPVGFRIPMKGFDFSCLGEDKGMLARENIRALVVLLKKFAPNARLDTDYRKARSELDDVWQIEQRKDSKGLRRQNFGKLGMGHIESSTNIKQFTKYSRLQWHLK